MCGEKELPNPETMETKKPYFGITSIGCFIILAVAIISMLAVDYWERHVRGYATWFGGIWVIPFILFLPPVGFLSGFVGVIIEKPKVYSIIGISLNFAFICFLLSKCI